MYGATMVNIEDYIQNNTLQVIVKPNSPRTELIEYDKNKKALKIALHAHPEKGEANKELIKFLKRELKRDVKIISGFTSKMKLVKIE